MTITIPIVTKTINATDAATPSVPVLRGADGSITATTFVGTGLNITGNITFNIVTKTANFTVDGTATDYLIDATGGAVTATMPLASSYTGVVINMTRKDNVTANAITLSTVLGTSSLSSQYQKVRVFSDGVSWYSV